jgi:Lon protease-like protein
VLPLNIFEPRYLAMLDHALATDRVIGMIQPTLTSGDIVRPGLVRVGCAGRITSFVETDDGRYVIALTGVARFVVGWEVEAETPFRQILADYRPYGIDLQPPSDDLEVDRNRLGLALRAFAATNEVKIDLEGVGKAPTEDLVNGLSAMLPFSQEQKQELLEAHTLQERFEVLLAHLELAALSSESDADEDRVIH